MYPEEEDTLLSWKVIHLPQLPEEKSSELCLANWSSRATHGVPDVTARPSSLRPSKNCTSSSALRLRNDLVLQGMLSARRTVPSTVMVFQMEFYSGTVTKQRYRSLKHLKTQYHTELNLGELKVTQGPKEIWYLLWKKLRCSNSLPGLRYRISLSAKVKLINQKCGFFCMVFTFIYFICVYVYWCGHVTAHIWKLEDNLQEQILPCVSWAIRFLASILTCWFILVALWIFLKC